MRPVSTPSQPEHFIGEHSYSTDDKPIAIDRPDAEDMAKAYEFGQAILKKSQTAQSMTDEPLQVPGNFPYKEVQMRATIVPAVYEELLFKMRRMCSCLPHRRYRLRKPCIDIERIVHQVLRLRQSVPEWCEGV